MASSARSGGMFSRREFMGLTAASAAAAAAGCATNPVTGRRQFMLMSEAEELRADRKYAPHQFSSDYGAVRDADLNGYVVELGTDMGALTHRPAVPYNFRVLNAVMVNAYTFPGGSVGVARGLMLALDNEAQLAAVLGHELGHVNARHAAERMTKTMLAMAVVSGLAAYVQHEKEEYADLAAGLGALGSNMLLSRYSRGDELEADWLGMEYANRAGRDPHGMPQVMETFQALKKGRPSVVELLFATHPLNSARRRKAEAALREHFPHATGEALGRERYQDRTAALRRLRGAIEAMQRGERSLRSKRYTEAENHLRRALKEAPDDYAGLLLMAKCQLAQGRKEAAAGLAERAKAVYPEEAQAHHVIGMSLLELRRFDAALAAFSDYERKLPGNPNTIAYRGICLEGMGRRKQAAAEYQRYRKEAPAGEFAGWAEQRLVEWGYLKPPEETP